MHGLLALETDETLLILKIAFLVLLYGFIVLIVRSATKGMGQTPQESIVLSAAEARVRDGDRITIGSTEIVFGRSLPS